MEPMSLSQKSRGKGRALALATALALAALSPAALAETGGPVPPGYTTDGPAPAAPPPAAPGPVAPATPAALQPVPVQQLPQAPDAVPVPDPAADADADQYADTDPSALTDFQDTLAPYGQWALDPTYGTVWVPDPAQVGADFAPYQTAGQWAVNDGGDWMWQSDYAWGFIPFHYGRWVWAGSYWGWIPGRRYAPAWVTWRVGDGGYVGWAPLPPTYYWAGGRAFGLRTRPLAAYCFVPTNYAFQHGVAAWVVRDRGMIQSVAATTRPYHPAKPTAGGQPASPHLSEAHIPASAAPRAYLARDARAMAFSTRSATAFTRSAARAGYAPGSVQGSRSPSYSLGYAPSRSRSYQGSPRAQLPALRTPGQTPAYTGVHTPPSYHSVVPPVHTASHPAAPVTMGGPFKPPSHPVAPTVSHPAPSTAGPASSSHGVHVSGGRRR
jgi:hypothetical protein